MKKNCYSCKHLDTWSDYSDGHLIGEGYMCEKQYEKAAERGKDIEHETNMGRKEYLEKAKCCCELK
jgi:hypothetical protein